MNLITKMVSFGITLIAMMTLLVGLAYYNMSQMSAALSVIGITDIPLSNAMSTVMNGQLSQSAWLERSLLAAELEVTEDLDQAVAQFDIEHRKVDLALQTALTISSDIRNRELTSEENKAYHEQQSILNNIRKGYDSYYEMGSDLLDFLQAGEIVKADNVLKKVQVQSGELVMLIDPVNQRISTNAQQSTQELVSSSRNALTSMGIIGFLAIALSLGLSFFITRSILVQLGADPAALEKVAEHLAEGKLEIEANYDTSGVAASISKTVSKLQDVISRIKSSAVEMSVASAQVGQGNTNLSQRTQEQASSLEEIAASMEEMTSTVNQNAENANQANQLALEATRQAEEGGSIAGEAVTAMSEINHASKEISEIIAVIDDIAFQINLLALNAAVEAARAGDQGRGFAVVAGEVRNLAGRSATAAKEIKELIRDSVTKVESGADLVGRTGNRLTEIVQSIKKVSDNVGEIAAASREQSDGITQVNRAILQMDDMTQQNASLVEEAAAASETVDNQASELLDLVSFFKLSQEQEQKQFPGPKYQQSYNYREPHDGPRMRQQPQLNREQRKLASARDSINKPRETLQSPRETVSADDEWEQF